MSNKRKYYHPSDFDEALEEAIERVAVNIRVQHEARVKLSRQAARDWMRQQAAVHVQEEEEEEEEQ